MYSVVYNVIRQGQKITGVVYGIDQCAVLLIKDTDVEIVRDVVSEADVIPPLIIEIRARRIADQVIPAVKRGQPSKSSSIKWALPSPSALSRDVLLADSKSIEIVTGRAPRRHAR